jgi:SAM-dependent methyltransferase
MVVEERTTPRTIDEGKLNAFVGKVIGDWGALASAPLVLIGEKLGLYTALAERGPATPGELARRTGTVERYVREWLLNQAAGGYVEYDAVSGRYVLPPEHAVVLPSLFSGFSVYLAATKAAPRIEEAFQDGGGVPWGEHDPAVIEGTDRFFRTGCEEHLVASWIPALDGVAAKLERGALVADIGCGYGTSTVIMAQAYPRSRFVGIDNHAGSIKQASQAAQTAGVADRVSFHFAAADAYSVPSGGYDLIAFFDSLHDMSDPIGAARQACDALAPDGTVLVVEPMAGNSVEENLNPLGRTLSAASTMICTPNSLATGGLGLGTLASDVQLEAVLTAGGFSRFRRATETPFNRVFEARR